MDPVIVTTQSRLQEAVDLAVRKAIRAAATPSQPPPPKDWLTNAEAMDYLGLSRPTLARYRATGRLRYSKVGSSVYYRRADVEALLEAGAR